LHPWRFHFLCPLPFISVIPLAERDMKTVHVVIFSEKVRNQDVGTWLSRYCEVFNGTEVVDIDGIKTGTRRFQVRLRRRDGALEHLPSYIQLGAFRGTVFYPGQPKECRKCGNCNATDHSSLQCSIPLKCNLCSSTKHKFKDCPQAYANQVKLSTTPLFHE
uniref:Zinc finger CCHC domain-containing protein n=1 Tax=Anabas testudineus TaxID=64144 RepID=A0A3Q1HD29_ANATE